MHIWYVISNRLSYSIYGRNTWSSSNQVFAFSFRIHKVGFVVRIWSYACFVKSCCLIDNLTSQSVRSTRIEMFWFSVLVLVEVLTDHQWQWRSCI